MKRYLLSVLMILLVTPCFAEEGWQESRLNVGVVSGGVAAASCTAPVGAVLTETFGDSSAAECWSGLGGTTCNQTWTQGGTAVQSIVASPGTPPASTACTNSLRTNITTGANQTTLTRAIAEDNTGAVLTFSIYVVTGSLPTADDIARLIQLTHAGNEECGMILYRDGATLNARSIGGAMGEAIAISTNTWYVGVLTYVAGQADTGCTLTINSGTSDCSPAGYLGIDGIVVGKVAYNLTPILDYYIGNLKLD